ncbi:MAG: hypothetical protein ACKVZ0_02230 [Gemmatimonadales bacterium]
MSTITPIGAVLLVAAATIGCAPRSPSAPLRTITLPAPELTQPAFEPHLAIDPANPDRIVVAAQYGISRNRGGRKIWTWQSEDGGRIWTGAEMPLPGAAPTMAADPVVGFATDGAALLTFLFADSTTFQGGAAFTRTGTDDLQFGPASVVVRDRLGDGGGAIDKGWLAVDRSPTSPFRGTVYVTWHANRPLPDRTVESIAWIAASRSQGRTWDEPRPIGPYFGTQLTARGDGSLDLVFGDRTERVLLHARSIDGGQSVASIDTIAVVAESLVVDLPSLAVTKEDRPVVCLTMGPRERLTDFQVHCATDDGTGGWHLTRLDDPGDRVAGLPAVAVDGEAIWVASYSANDDSTSVRLHRSRDGGRTFVPFATLASRPFGRDRFCPAPASPCRGTLGTSGAFFPGDYIGIVATGTQVIVAYALPDGPNPGDRSSIQVTIVRP